MLHGVSCAFFLGSPSCGFPQRGPSKPFSFIIVLINYTVGVVTTLLREPHGEPHVGFNQHPPKPLTVCFVSNGYFLCTKPATRGTYFDMHGRYSVPSTPARLRLFPHIVSHLKFCTALLREFPSRWSTIFRNRCGGSNQLNAMSRCTGSHRSRPW